MKHFFQFQPATYKQKIIPAEQGYRGGVLFVPFCGKTLNYHSVSKSTFNECLSHSSS
jgi:hypothetical protein